MGRVTNQIYVMSQIGLRVLTTHIKLRVVTTHLKLRVVTSHMKLRVVTSQIKLRVVTSQMKLLTRNLYFNHNFRVVNSRFLFCFKNFE